MVKKYHIVLNHQRLRQTVALLVVIIFVARNLVRNSFNYNGDYYYGVVVEVKNTTTTTTSTESTSSNHPQLGSSLSPSTTTTITTPSEGTYVVPSIPVSSSASSDFDYRKITPGGKDTCFVHIGKTAGSRIGCILGMPHLPTCQIDSLVWKEHEALRQQEANNNNNNNHNNDNVSTASGVAAATTIPDYFLFSSSPEDSHFIHMDVDECHVSMNKRRKTKKKRRPYPLPAVYLVTTRNPLVRLQSAFYYQKTTPAVPERAPLYTDCYNNFKSLISEGLDKYFVSTSMDANNNSNNNNKTLASSIWNMTCPERAFAYTIGARAFGHHAWYNYEYYYDRITSRFLQETTTTSTSSISNKNIDNNNNNNNKPFHVFVLRQEFLHQDWTNMDRLFGGTGGDNNDNNNNNNNNNNTTNNGSSIIQNTFLETKLNPTPSNNDVVEMSGGTTTTTTTGTNKNLLENLCRALCLEIQYYKRILEAAVNLDETDIEESMQELRIYCPNEPTNVRSCTTTTTTTTNNNNNDNKGIPTYFPPPANPDDDDSFVLLGKPRFLHHP